MRDLIHFFLQQKPFRPFRLRLTCRSVFDIQDPALTRLTESTLRLGFLDTSVNPPVLVDRHILSLDHVVSLEPLEYDEPLVVPASPTE